MKNILNAGADVAGSLGLKGFLTLCCLTVGTIGMSYGIKTSNKLNVLIEKVEKYEKDEPQKVEAQKTNNDMMDKVNDMYEVIKSLEEQAGSDDKLKTLVSDLKNIQEKIDNFGVVYDQAKDSGLDKFISTLKEFREDLVQSQQELSQSVNKLSGDLSRKLDHFTGEFESSLETLKKQTEFRDELVQSQMDISKSVNNFTGTISKKIDQFTGEIENVDKIVNSLVSGVLDVKEAVTEVKEEVLNNQTDIEDINNAVYALDEKIDCLTKRAKREEVAKPETAPQLIVESNLIEVDSSEPSPSVDTPTDNTITESNLVDLIQVNTHKDEIRGQIGEINSEFTEENPIQLENLEGKIIEHHIGLIETVEDSGTEMISGYGEIEVHLDDGKSVLVVNSTEENAEIGIIEDTVPFIAIDTSDIPTFNDINIDISSNYIHLDSRPLADVVSGQLKVEEIETSKN